MSSFKVLAVEKISYLRIQKIFVVIYKSFLGFSKFTYTPIKTCVAWHSVVFYKREGRIENTSRDLLQIIIRVYINKV